MFGHWGYRTKIIICITNFREGEFASRRSFVRNKRNLALNKNNIFCTKVNIQCGAVEKLFCFGGTVVHNATDLNVPQMESKFVNVDRVTSDLQHQERGVDRSTSSTNITKELESKVKFFEEASA
jgi:hypothetical protein